MKKSNTFFKRAMITIACCISMGATIRAQICPPVWPDVTTGSGSASISSTGNDVAYNGCDWLRVQVYNGTSPGISWQTDDYCLGNGFNAGSAAFSLSDATDPDVVLVHDQVSSVWYAIAVYYSPSAGRYFYNPWKYNGTGFVDGGPMTLEGSSLFGTAINIDANEKGEFVIVWDNPNLNRIRSVAGYTDLGVGPYLCGSPITLPNTVGYHMPDVAIAENNNGPGGAYIHYTYVYPAYDKLLVTLDKQYYICNNMPNFIVEYSNAITNTGDVFVEPRIACPNASGLISDWSVVWLYLDNSNFYYEVQGANQFSGGINTWGYTDGSQLPTPDPQGQYHKRPCIAYSGYGTSPQDGIQISWTTAWPSVTSGTTIIGLQLDLKGAVIGSCYQIDPQSVPSDGQDISSLAGRHSKFMTSCYYDWNYVSDVLTKDFFWFTGFRLGSTTSEALANSGISPNPSGGQVQLNLISNHEDAIYKMTITDISGRLMVQSNGSLAEIKVQAEKGIPLLSAGSYLLNISSNQEGKIWTQKIIRN